MQVEDKPEGGRVLCQFVDVITDEIDVMVRTSISELRLDRLNEMFEVDVKRGEILLG